MSRPTPLADRSWTEVADDAAHLVILVPVGSTEQHGPHLPLDTDTRIAVAIAEEAAGRAPDRVVVAPALGFGSSGEHADFPGTLSIGTEVLTQVLLELGRSADGFAGMVFVNGHGGNHEALRAAVMRLEEEGRRVGSWSWSSPGADAHAGRTETSLLLTIAPDTVEFDRAEPGRTEPIVDLIEDLRASGVRAVSPNGVLGDPTGASAPEGRDLLDRFVTDLLTTVAALSGSG